METFGSDEALLAAIIVPTCPANVANVPSLTMPAGFTDRGTPLGFQFVGAEFSEQLLLQAGHAYQSVTDFHRGHPNLS